MVEAFKDVEKIVKKWSETNMEDWGYDGISGYMRVEGNPYEGQIWNVLSELRYVDGITKIELRLAEDMDNDYDTLDIEFIEIYPKKDIEYYKEMLRVKNQTIERLEDEIESLKNG